MAPLLTAALILGSAPMSELKTGDRLAIIGDSITEQRIYSRMIATYLTACRPDLQIDVRQLGWGGETAGGFLRRMDQDCLRFKPTVATICYGMNDACALSPEPAIRDLFRQDLGQIVDRLQANGARVLIGSPGILTKAPSWRKSPETADDLNSRLKGLGDIALDLANSKETGFADVHGSMSRLRAEATPIYGDKMEVAGPDGIHPGAAGHLAMAMAFLQGFDLGRRDLARFTVDVSSHRVVASEGHQQLGFDGRTLLLRSARYPFVLRGAESPTQSAVAAAPLIGFYGAVDRFMLVVTGLKSPQAKVTWGTESHVFARDELEKGVNLMSNWSTTPFDAAFARVDEAVDALQTFETLQVKMVFRSEEYLRAPDWRTSQSESVRSALLRASREAVRPVDHALVIEPLSSSS